MLKVTEIEVVADSPNHCVVRTPGRQHPALVVQGDAFHSIVTDVESLAGKLAAATGRVRPWPMTLKRSRRPYESGLPSSSAMLPLLRCSCPIHRRGCNGVRDA